jgi:hypothetical protein
MGIAQARFLGAGDRSFWLCCVDGCETASTFLDGRRIPLACQRIELRRTESHGETATSAREAS